MKNRPEDQTNEEIETEMYLLNDRQDSKHETKPADQINSELREGLAGWLMKS